MSIERLLCAISGTSPPAILCGFTSMVLSRIIRWQKWRCTALPILAVVQQIESCYVEIGDGSSPSGLDQNEYRSGSLARSLVFVQRSYACSQEKAWADELIAEGKAHGCWALFDGCRPERCCTVR